MVSWKMFWRSEHCSDCMDKGLLILRLALGIVFLIHGAGKLFNFGPAASGMSSFVGFLTSSGIPLPILFAWIAVLVQFFGGIFLIAGFMTRISSSLIAFEMLVAVLLTTEKGFSSMKGGFEYALALMVFAIALMMCGPGRFSFDRRVFK